ncbi:uncharacterized protein [Temnothorax nylanderi]|uniref:uncharacterized protein isoform X2 n=1 Tax=Temnothorax nylanderi TaxID=102681 RepID=UPI003A895733
MSESEYAPHTSVSEQSSDDDSCEDNKFLIIEFVMRGRKGKRSLDIVPINWVDYDKKKGKCMVKFQPPPYTAEVQQSLEKLVKASADPPNFWPTYSFKIKGRAKSYNEASQKLQSLQDKLFVFTSDTELEPEEQAAEIEAACKSRALKKELSNVKALMSVKPLPLPETHGGKSKQSHSSSKCSKEGVDIIKHKTHTISQKEFQLIDENENRVAKNKMQGKQLKCQSIGDNNRKHSSNNINKNEACPLIPSSVERNGSKTNSKKFEHIDSRAFKILMDALQDILQSIKLLEKNQNTIMALLEASDVIQHGVGVNSKTFTEKYEINLPLKSLDEFNDFEECLNLNEDCKRDYFASLHFLADRHNNVTRSVTNMIKKYLSRELALQCTAQKQVEGKMVLKNTLFCNAIIDVLTNKHGAIINEKDSYTALGNCLSNAKDWEGHRSQRRRKD